MTAPVRTFFSFVRTNAPPLPGLTCWNSTTENRPSGRSRLIPFFKSFVLTLIRWPRSGPPMGLDSVAATRPANRRASCPSAPSSNDQFLREVGDRPAPGLGDDHGVLDANASKLGEVD